MKQLFKTAIFISMLGLLAACAGTTAAYKAADGIQENGKVVAEHYFALVNEANVLKEQGILAGGDLVQAQNLVRQSRPVIDGLINAGQAFEATQNATTEAELEAAISAAAVAISQLIDIIKAARDSSALEQLRGPPLVTKTA